MLRFFIPVLLVGLCLPIGTMALVEPVTGDLARVGSLPERAFGWNDSQTEIWGAPSNAAPGDAKILIIGDSFSKLGYWQSSAFSPSQRYVTFGFGQICSDFGAYIKRLGLSPQVVIVESIERLFAARFFDRCTSSELSPPAGNAIAPTPPARLRRILYGSYSPRYVLGGLLYLAFPGPQHRTGDSGGVDVRAVSDGCRVFSNADCPNALFLGEDRLLPSLPLIEFDSPMIEYLKTSGVENILVIPVPNKTSIYLNSIERARNSDRYLLEFARRNGVHVIRLQEQLFAAKSEERDLYFPDDTHLSSKSQRALGKQVGQILASIESRAPLGRDVEPLQ